MIIIQKHCKNYLSRKIKEEKKFSIEYEGLNKLRLSSDEDTLENNNIDNNQPEFSQEETNKEKSKLTKLFNNEIQPVEKKEEKKIKKEDFPDLDEVTNDQDNVKKKDNKAKNKKKKFQEVDMNLFKNISDNQKNLEKPIIDPKNKIKK